MKSGSLLRRISRELLGLYWDSGVANDVPALAWFLMSSLVPLALGLTALAAMIVLMVLAASAGTGLVRRLHIITR